jgi:hypothetical protein
MQHQNEKFGQNSFESLGLCGGNDGNSAPKSTLPACSMCSLALNGEAIIEWMARPAGATVRSRRSRNFSANTS